MLELGDASQFQICQVAAARSRYMAERLNYGIGSWLSRGAVIALGIVISGCTVTSNGMTPTSVTVRTPGTLPSIPTAAPPGITPVPPPSGTFSGVAQLS